jgi:ligand-binding sensor domain-containing protein
MKFLRLLVLCLALPLPGLAAPLVPGGERVLDSFEIGSSVVARALSVDRASNTLWVGTSVGVLEIDLKTQNVRNTFTRQHGLANESVLAIGTDSQGSKWFGTNAGGATRIKEGIWKTYFPMHGLADYWVYGFANDRDGSLWIATRAGVNRLDVRTGKMKTYARELANEWVYGVAVDGAGKVWFGTHGGVSMFDGKDWKSWTHQNGLGAANINAKPNNADSMSYNPDYVLTIFCAPDQSVWAGTLGGGVSRYDGKGWTNLNSGNGLAGNIVYAIARDAKGVFWFGTDNGVSRYDGKTWKNIGVHQGLPDKNVYALALAPNGDIWAGTGKGVTRIGMEQAKR